MTPNLAPNLAQWVLARLSAPLPGYARMLDRAFSVSPPACGEGWFERSLEDSAQEPRWLMAQLFNRARDAAERAERLWDVAARALDPMVAENFRQHAIDESRHAKMFAWVLAQVFPDRVSERAMAKVNALAPGYAPDDHPTPLAPLSDGRVLDAVIRANLEAVRACRETVLIWPHVVRAAGSGAPASRVAWMGNRLAYDDMKHVLYTASILDAECIQERAAFVEHLFTEQTTERMGMPLSDASREIETVRPPANAPTNSMVVPKPNARSRMAG